MNKKIILQLVLITLIMIIIFITYYFNFYQKKISNIDNKISNLDTKTSNLKDDSVDVFKENSSSIIKNIKYTSTDNKGNKYEIVSAIGKIDLSNQDIIYMTDVKALISFVDSEIIEIKSNFAKYNSKNYDTNFSENVLVTYEEHKIMSDNLDLFFEKHMAQIMNNLIYESSTTSLKADKIEIDLITKNSKIFMYNDQEKIKIDGKI